MVKEVGRLKLYIDGELTVTSSPFDPEDYNLSTDEPLRIGFGELDYFRGKMRDVRLYDRSINQEQIRHIYAEVKDSL